MFISYGVGHTQAPPFVAGSNTGQQCNGNATCTITIGTHSDGQVILFAGSSGAMNGSSLPSGGSSPLTCPINTNGNGWFCWKVWHTGDPTSYGFNAVTGTPSWVIGSAIWSGEDTSTPVHEVNQFQYSATSNMNPSGGTLVAPGISPSFLTETRIAIVIDQGGTPTTPTGMTQRMQDLGSVPRGVTMYDKALVNTTPDPDLSAGNPDGLTASHSMVYSFLIKPASATSGTRNPVPYLACYGDVGHITDSMDLSNCSVQNGDLVETCANIVLPMQGLSPPTKFNNQISRGFTNGVQATSGIESHCTYGYWHTGDPTTFNWTKGGTSNTGGIQFFTHRVNGGTTYVGQATTSTVQQVTNSVTSKALITTQQYAKWIQYLGTSGSPTFTPPSGAVSFIQGGNGSYQNAIERDLTSTGSTGTDSWTLTGTPNSAVFGWILAAATSFTTPTVNASGSACTNAPSTNVVNCTPPSGTMGDLLIAPIFELDDPGQSVLNGLAPSGWNLLKYQNDYSLGIQGVTVPDKSLVTLGGLQQLIGTKNTVSPSGTTSYTIHSCFQSPQMWGGGGGLMGIDGNQNGTNDTLDKALRMNSSGQITYAHGATSSVLTGATVITSPLLYNDGLRHCAAGTFDGTNMRLYLDGTLVAGPTAPSTASVTLPTTGYWVMGYTKQPGFFYGAPFVEGQFAEWDGTALSGAQVASIDTHIFDGTFDTAMNALSPTHWWKLNDTAYVNGAADSGTGTNDPGIFINFRGQLNQISAGGMGDKVPWFGGLFLISTGNQVQGPSIITASSETPSNSSFSIETFIQEPSGFTGGGFLAGYEPAQNGTNVTGSTFTTQFLYIGSDNKAYVGMFCGGGGSNDWVSTSSSVTVNDGALHLIDGVWNGSNLQVYVDGSASGSSVSCSAPGALGWTNWFIMGSGVIDSHFTNAPGVGGGGGGPNGGAWNGGMGRTSFYNGANTLTSIKIANHYAHRNDGTFDTVVLADNPLHFYKENETHGAAATDYGSANNAGTYSLFQTLAWTVWTKTRAASESAVNFPLGDNALAVGQIVDVSNVIPSLDGSNWYPMSALNGNSFDLGELTTATNDLQISLLGLSSNSALISSYPNPTTLLSGVNSNGLAAQINMAPYQNTMPDDGAYSFTSTSWNLGVDILLAQGIPPPLGGKVLIFIGQ